jgi:hypothetical protein
VGGNAGDVDNAPSAERGHGRSENLAGHQGSACQIEGKTFFPIGGGDVFHGVFRGDGDGRGVAARRVDQHSRFRPGLRHRSAQSFHAATIIRRDGEKARGAAFRFDGLHPLCSAFGAATRDRDLRTGPGQRSRHRSTQDPSATNDHRHFIFQGKQITHTAPTNRKASGKRSGFFCFPDCGKP